MQKSFPERIAKLHPASPISQLNLERMTDTEGLIMNHSDGCNNTTQCPLEQQCSRSLHVWKAAYRQEEVSSIDHGAISEPFLQPDPIRLLPYLHQPTGWFDMDTDNVLTILLR